MTRSPSPLEKLKRLVRGIALWRFVRLLWRAPLAYREAVRLAQVMWRRSYRDAAPHWQPLDDTGGVISQIDNMHAGVVQELEELRTKYSELLYEVAQKHEGESRHDTARRYIRERENRIEGPACDALPNNQGLPRSDSDVGSSA